jgi:hypothetical protein
VRHGKLRLRFDCRGAAGCVATTFAIRPTAKQGSPGVVKLVAVRAAPAGSRIVTVKLGRAARLAIAHAGRRGLDVSLSRAGTGNGRRFRLVAAR